MSRKATPIEKVEAEITDVKANIKELQVEIKASKDRDEKTALRSDKKDAVDRLKMLDARLTMLLQQRSSTTDSGKCPLRLLLLLLLLLLLPLVLFLYSSCLVVRYFLLFRPSV
jgi:hypothetical protein